jgi:ABC-type xylose transport system permease subunit
MLVGLFNGVMIVVFGLPSLVVTIGTLALYRGLAQIILKERGVNSFPDWYQQIGFGTIGDSPIPWSVILYYHAFPRIWILPSSDTRRPRDLRHWQQSRSRAIVGVYRAHNPWRVRRVRDGVRARSDRSYRLSRACRRIRVPKFERHLWPHAA